MTAIKFIVVITKITKLKADRFGQVPLLLQSDLHSSILFLGWHPSNQ